MQNNPIGIFDSGVGGLTVLKELQNHLPNESFIYYGDTARAPWGDTPKETLKKYLDEILSFLIEKKVKYIVMGCNTTYSYFYQDLKQEWPVKIIGLAENACLEAIHLSQNNRIAVLATTGTINSHSYRNNLIKLDPNVEVLEIACPEIVPLIENNQLNNPKADQIAEKYMKIVTEFGVDTIIHGCTHYPFFEPNFRKFTTKPIIMINPATSIISIVKNTLINSELLNNDNKSGNIDFFVSGNPQNFKAFINNLMNFQNYQLTQHSF